MKTSSLKKSILIPLTLGLIFLLSAFIINTYRTEYKGFADEVGRKLGSAEEFFEKQLSSDTETISLATELLSTNQQIQNVWLTKNREALLKLALPILARLHDRHKITHFYFHDTNRVNFLRVHKPEKHGDLINRYTMLEAQKTGQISSGIELGPLGTFTLRVVCPIKINDQLVGFIELGEEIDHIIQKLKGILEIELYISIYKKFLDREEWISGMQMLGHESNWDQFPSSVIVSQTLKEIPTEFSDFLIEGHHKYMEMIADLKLSMGNQLYRVGVIPLYDVGGREVGDMVVLYDVIEHLSKVKRSILVFSSIWIFIGIVLYVFFSMILGRVEMQLNEYSHNLENLVEKRTNELTIVNEKLRQEITVRKKAEEELDKHRQHLEKLVNERTAKLTQTNTKLKKEVAERKRAEKEVKELNKNLEERVQVEVEKSRQKDYIMIQQSRLAAMGEMINYIIHQWGQPLNALRILFYNFQDSLEDIGIKEKNIYEYIAKGQQLIENKSSTSNDFSDFFKTQKKKVIFNIKTIIKGTISIIYDSYKFSKIKIILNETDEELLVKGFPNEYSQVILNVFKNAKDAISAKGVNGEIKISLLCKNDSAIVRIKDNGGGISEDIMDNIFDSYFTTKAEGKGSGIGLYMSKVIIEKRMSGHINVKNTNDGAEFEISLPMVQL